MIYKPSELTTLNNVVQPPFKFYSQGIADGVQFPVQNGHGHDFVIGEMAPANNAGTYCYPTTGLMTRTDSIISAVKGALFQGMPNGFVCLNEYTGYLDTYDTNVYASNNTCPFDPTNPPSTRFTISGTITFTGTQNSANDAFTSAIDVITSDGEGNWLGWLYKTHLQHWHELHA